MIGPPADQPCCDDGILPCYNNGTCVNDAMSIYSCTCLTDCGGMACEDGMNSCSVPHQRPPPAQHHRPQVHPLRVQAALRVRIPLV
ncbi:unnamed protein product [Didymodactylos carnosus]|uniref:EGF-like domain-containing protein n=1 Tax=Didymodactylos carnosus TaxID=1234261 RepID=A0A8S2E383_9BILA|nr:unnamed protein product [Didymodactylos carnosus]CAF3821155.1 unnamed protein product [Didymodactylos carnosus]